MNKQGFKKLARAVLSCTVLITLLSGFALADEVPEPNDEFFAAHSNECAYYNRDLYANGESGYLELFDKPGGKTLGFADNGGLFRVLFSYKLGGESWGLVEYSRSGEKLVPRVNEEYVTGWIKMADTVLKYDYQSFDEMHGFDYKPYTGNYSELKNVQNIVIWTFPNSGESSGTIEKIDQNFCMKSIYTEPNGTRWGYIGYYYGMKNFWVCISKPTDPSLPAKDIPVPDLHMPQPGSSPESAGGESTTVIILCAAAAILCVSLVSASRSKKKRGASAVK